MHTKSPLCKKCVCKSGLVIKKKSMLSMLTLKSELDKTIFLIISQHTTSAHFHSIPCDIWSILSTKKTTKNKK